MKIKPEDYSFMRDQIARIDPDRLKVHRENLKSDARLKDIDKRMRWDVVYAAGLLGFTCDVLYKYMSDDHIDTALRKIQLELGF